MSQEKIAEFIGMQLTSIGWYDSEDVLKLSYTEDNTFDDLLFHTWEWLMSVVEFIEDFHSIGGEELEFQVVIYEDEVKIIAKHTNKPWETIVEISADGSGKKENTYKAVVQFIEWYNENNSK